ncbi:hypothetical protein D3C76_1171020 [compost metagenome]
MVLVAEVAELPDQLGAGLRRADRVEQRDQAAAAAGVHEEGFVAGVEQQRLVAGQRQSAVRLVGLAEDACGALQLGFVRLVDGRRLGAQQPGQRHRGEQQATAEGGAQAARGVGVEGELPPEFVAVGHVLIGEQQQPDGRADHADGGGQVEGREGQLHQPAAAVEGMAEHHQQDCGDRQDRRFLPVEAL